MREKCNKSGFTLLELLVAMALISMVTLVVTVALKLSIQSWERGVEEGETSQLWVAIPALMTKQLDSLIKFRPFNQATGRQMLPFYGKKNALSFITSYAPQGSPWQGLLRVTYVFEEEQETLYLFEQVITRKDDLSDAYDPLSDKWEDTLKPISQVPGISGFDLTYARQHAHNPQGPVDWQDAWEGTSTSLPTRLGVKLQVGTGANSEARNFYFRLGGIGL